MNTNVKKLTLSGVFLALCIVLPFLTGGIPKIGNVLSPMHIPVLLCGFVCGGPYGLLVGFVAPLLRFALFGMPPIFPTGLSMAFELASYGFLSGILYKKLPKKLPYIYVTLITSMVLGRVVWGIVRFLFAKLFSIDFSVSIFVNAAFITAIPGIIIHIIIIPILVVALKKARLFYNE